MTTISPLMMMMPPLPVSLMMMMMMIPHCVGYDSKFGFQLYQTDPSGNYSGWKATVIGNSEALLQRLYSTDSLLVGAPSSLPVCTHTAGQNNQAGKSILKTDYKPENTVEENLKVAVKILLKTMDSATPGAERIELSTLRKDAEGAVQHYTLTDAEVHTLDAFGAVELTCPDLLLRISCPRSSLLCID